MGDSDFAEDFASSLWETMDNLLKECDRVSKDCIARKHALDNALADFKEEEVVQLVNNSEDDAALSR